MSKPTVLIIDDERNTREGLKRAFGRKYRILLAEDGAGGLRKLRGAGVDVVLTDLRMPGMDGMAFTREATHLPTPPLVIMLTAYGTLQTAVEAMKEGAYDYITKPVNLDNLEMMIDRGLESRRLRRENEELRSQLDNRYGFDSIIGNSPPMVEVFETARQVAAARTTVLLTGESGTGKELFARAIHNLSPRRDRPFVVVHCAALSETLLESELFGHERGAYTGAHEQVAGRFERADGGTLFLDEIGEVNASTQIKLLRVLEARTFERVGGTDSVEVDVRVVAATNRNLRDLVNAGAFREDLYFRLNVVNIELPPLRDRSTDIPLLLDHFLAVFTDENGKLIEGFSSEATKILCAHRWPGNVREIRNVVERMVVMARGNVMTLKDVPADIRSAVAAQLEDEQATPEPTHTLDIDSNERDLIVRALTETGGNRTEAARRLGISRRTLHRKIHTYELEDL